jgi:hypothetical protein
MSKLLEMPVHDGGGEEPAIAMGSVGGLQIESAVSSCIVDRCWMGKFKKFRTPSLNPVPSMNKSKTEK